MCRGDIRNTNTRTKDVLRERVPQVSATVRVSVGAVLVPLPVACRKTEVRSKASDLS